MNSTSQMSLFVHHPRHFKPSKPQCGCPDTGNEPIFQPRGPGGSGYPRTPIAPPPGDDDTYDGKGPGGSGYPGAAPIGGDIDLIC